MSKSPRRRPGAFLYPLADLDVADQLGATVRPKGDFASPPGTRATAACSASMGDACPHVEAFIVRGFWGQAHLFWPPHGPGLASLREDAIQGRQSNPIMDGTPNDQRRAGFP